MFSGFLLIESDDESLNWLNNKLRFGVCFRFMEIPVFALLFLLLSINELKFLLFFNYYFDYVLNFDLKQNYGSVRALICWKPKKFD